MDVLIEFFIICAAVYIAIFIYCCLVCALLRRLLGQQEAEFQDAEPQDEIELREVVQRMNDDANDQIGSLPPDMLMGVEEHVDVEAEVDETQV